MHIQAATDQAFIAGAELVIEDRKPIDITQSGAPAPSVELLPAKYHQNTELKYDAQFGKHEKNWDLAN